MYPSPFSEMPSVKSLTLTDRVRPFPFSTQYLGGHDASFLERRFVMLTLPLDSFCRMHETQQALAGVTI